MSDVPKWAMNRRAFLRGLGGAAIYLPFLEAMIPFNRAHAANVPPRMIYLWFDLGVYKDDWVPSGNGFNWNLPNVLAPLQQHKNDIMMLRRVRNYYGDSHNEGGGDHARSIGTFLTCAHSRYGSGHPSADFGLPVPSTAQLSHSGPKNTQGFADFHRRTYTDKIEGSVDQIAARMQWNEAYRLKYLQMRRGGGGDSHHNTVNQHLSWTDHTTPAPRYGDLHSLFDAIFSKRPQEDPNSENDAKRADLDKSILDTVGPTVKKLGFKVGREDQLRIEKYLSEVRDLERKVASTRPESTAKQCGLQSGERPDSSSPRFDDHIRTTMKLFVKAFQCDITRVVTHGWHYGGFSFLKDSQGRSVSKASHNFYSHHGSREEAREGLRRINRFWAELLSEFLTEMKQTDENFSGSLLDNSQILFGCGMQDGNSHNSDRGSAELPLVLAGRASGQWSPGKLVDTGNRIRLSDIHLNMLRNMGHNATKFGDSEGINLNL